MITIIRRNIRHMLYHGRFQAYFKKGLRYLNGGVKTGLSHYVEDKNPKLFHVKVASAIKINVLLLPFPLLLTMVLMTHLAGT